MRASTAAVDNGKSPEQPSSSHVPLVGRFLV
jgi:hypothetical protein